ncbi:MAG: hypothetical protein M1828_004879 [Chrysothrix sp. TS-e1954]|nr:MAG: hypothetical protein M1828_004879 [Chrysothrix sp. TS-e1954]
MAPEEAGGDAELTLDDLKLADDASGPSEDTAWEIEQGIPQASDQVLTKYHQGRDALIAQENKHRSDESFRSLLSPLAREAASIVSAIRFEESQTVWTPDYEDSLAWRTQQDIFPGMMFTLAKERMEQTKIWQIVRKMPKGALLHCHLEAMVDFGWLFGTAIAEDGMCISADRPILEAADCETAKLRFQYTKPSSTDFKSSLYSKDYTPDTLVPLMNGAEAFPSDPEGNGGGIDDFVDWLCSRCTISPDDSLNHHHGPNDVWRRFMGCFELGRQVIYYEPIFRKFLRQFFEKLLEDGVRYVDIRIAFTFVYQQAGREEPDEGYDALLTVMEEEIKAFQATEQGKSFWGARLIWTTLRGLDNRAIADSMLQCIAAKQAHPDLIAGYDLVGQEDLGRPLSDLALLLLWFRKQCAQAGVAIPFFFHAGETCQSGGDADLNLFDAFLLGTRRIGHGFSIYKHPLLMNMAKDRRVLVECCPISNEVLRLTSSIASHPLPAMLAQGVPVALCNDDPAMLGQGTAGMSHDFFQCLQSIESLGLEGLGALAENSVRWAAFEDADSKTWTEGIRDGAYGKTGIRAQRMKEWKQDWEKFCQWVVLEFGADVDVDPDE